MPPRKLCCYVIFGIVLLICAAAIIIGIYFTIKNETIYSPTCTNSPYYNNVNATYGMYRGPSLFPYILTSNPGNVSFGSITIDNIVKTPYKLSMNTLTKEQISYLIGPSSSNNILSSKYCNGTSAYNLINNQVFLAPKYDVTDTSGAKLITVQMTGVLPQVTLSVTSPDASIVYGTIIVPQGTRNFIISLNGTILPATLVQMVFYACAVIGMQT